METPLAFWIGFNLFVLAMLALDLGVFHRKAHVIRFREAMTWSAVWISLALIFNAGVYYYFGPAKGTEFLTGYLIEKALSVDNIFVFIMLFSFFHVKPQHQHKILFWGILGALVMRAILIFAGVALINRFHFIIYVFGGFLILTGIKMALDKDRKMEPEKNLALRIFRRFVPMTRTFVEDHFFVRQEGRLLATPMLAVLVVVEVTDLIFAIDSIPAILAISQDPFIVYTSNVFAILGLRALYFALAGVMDLFHYLVYGLSAILVFVGTKMIMVDVVKIPVLASLIVIASILAVSVTASLLHPRKVIEDPVPIEPGS